MRFTILKAGTATRYGREVLGDYDGMFRALLAGEGEDWEVHDVENGAFPPDLARFDGVVVTGSASAAYDQAPWIGRLLQTIGEAHALEIPLLGVCFGAQAVALALGGAVAPNPGGWDIGLTELTLSPAAEALPGFAPAPNPLRVLQTHYDAVTRMPDGGVLLASSDKTEVEMYRLGQRVLCLQGHPEMDRKEVEVILLKKPGLPEAVVESGLASLVETPDREFLPGILRDFLRNGGLRRSQPKPAAAP